jgi:hypothetical protein
MDGDTRFYLMLALGAVLVLIGIAYWGAVAYVALHFINKYW